MDFKAMFTDLKDNTEQFDKSDIEKGKLMSVLSYLGILSLIPFFVEKENKYVRFHAIQGLNLFVFSIIYSVALSILSIILAFIPIIGWLLIIVLGLVSYAIPVFCIMGIVFACQDKAKEVPVVNKLKLIKQ